MNELCLTRFRRGRPDASRQVTFASLTPASLRSARPLETTLDKTPNHILFMSLIYFSAITVGCSDNNRNALKLNDDKPNNGTLLSHDANRSLMLPIGIITKIASVRECGISALTLKPRDDEKVQEAKSLMKDLSESLSDFMKDNDIENKYTEEQIRTALEDAGFYDLILIMRNLEIYIAGYRFKYQFLSNQPLQTGDGHDTSHMQD